MTDLPTISPRYRLLALLGAGGMGMVYRADDRLQGRPVALKRVTLTTEEPDDDRLALAHEFQVLAGLRHPNIISVLDYGFDDSQQPFFTMELAEGAQTILEAGRDLALAERLELILQVAEALAYLHRRGVLHHDLKPENILVSAGRARLLDFGLAVLACQQRESDAFGTLQYLAPEVLDGDAYSERADLYSLGVIAYELLAGRHPFEAPTVSSFLAQVHEQPPDLSALAGRPELVTIVGALLSKQPHERLGSAEATISALRAAAGPADTQPDRAIRESYLQAAAFVGREAELAQLTEALAAAQRGQGSAWLVGGESGVGKSRLIDELRAQALVAGAYVMRGQAVEGGGQPYQIWREPLRLLALAAGPSELEAAVLKPIVPDIAELVGRPVADAPALPGGENVQRLARVILALLLRVERPLVLLFEDLQWAEEGMQVLRDAARVLGDRPLMVVGSYRDDERPDLPRAVPEAQVITLARLGADGIAQLSAAMLGAGGRRPEVLDLLARETEGNAFFMVEVVRALAEESGQLADIGVATLPARVLTGGVRRIVQRRLRRVPEGSYPLVQLAAVLGRQIDVRALAAAAPGEDLGRWLVACADAQVLEAQGDGWRFAHDKLREGAQLELGERALADLHAQAAAAIERAYAGDLDSHAGRLAEHYRQAGDARRELAAARQAGDYAARTFAQADAARHYGRALDLAEAPAERFALLLAREEILDLRGERAAQEADLQALEALAEQSGSARWRADAAQRRVRQALSSGDLTQVPARAARALDLARALGDGAAEALVRLRWGSALMQQGSFGDARAQLSAALGLARAGQQPHLEIDCLRSLAAIAEMGGDAEAGRAPLHEALALSRQIGDLQREGQVTNSLAVLASHDGDYQAEEQLYHEALRISRLTGNLRNECLTLANLGLLMHTLGDYDQAERYYRHAYEQARLAHNQLLVLHPLRRLGRIAYELGEFEQAQQHLTQVLAGYRSLGARRDEIFTLVALSNVALALGDDVGAEQHARSIIAIASAAQLQGSHTSGLAALGRALQQRGDYAGAAEAYQAILDRLSAQGDEVDRVRAWVGLGLAQLAQGDPALAARYAGDAYEQLRADPSLAVNDPIGMALACYEVLAAVGDPRAAAALAAGHQDLQRRAASIRDGARRQRFLTRVRANRELLAAWESAPPQPAA